MSFEQYMAEQREAIEASGLEPEEWIELNAEQFRADHPITE
jgi:hypothetical protein